MDNILSRATNFFLKLHYVALFYAFIDVLAIMGYIGIYIAFPFSVLAFFIPIGSTALTSPYLALFILYGVLPRLPIYILISIAITLKLILYMNLRGAQISRYSVVKVLLLATITIQLYSILIYESMALSIVSAITVGILVSIPMDLAIFSYVRYRDAVSGKASRAWIVALPALWSLTLWLPLLLQLSMNSGLTLSPIKTVVLYTSWTMITVTQLTLHIKYYYITQKVIKIPQHSDRRLPRNMDVYRH